MTLSLIVAASENNVIGDGGRLPWDLPDDLAHFRRKTIGHAVIIGNATYVSILCQLGKPLPGRLNVVLSRRTKSDATNSTVYCSSLQDALAVAKHTARRAGNPRYSSPAARASIGTPSAWLIEFT